MRFYALTDRSLFMHLATTKHGQSFTGMFGIAILLYMAHQRITPMVPFAASFPATFVAVFS